MDHREYIRYIPGSKNAVLLIHGICGSPAHFSQFVPLIPEDWSVYNLLLDGHGGDVKDFSATSMKKWKQQVSRQLALIRSRHKQVLLVAHSMGTLFAIEEAVTDPRKIAGLFLLNVPLRVHLPPSTILTATGAALGKTEHPAVKAVVDDTSIALTPWLWQYIGWAPRFWELLVQIRRVCALLPQLSIPTYTFHSQKDELVSERSNALLSSHPHISHTILPHCGHFAYKGEDLQLLKAAFKNWLLENTKNAL